MGYFGDCGIYHGWVVGVDINNPSSVGRLANNSDRRRNLGTQRRCQRRHEHVRNHREHCTTGGNWIGGEAYSVASRPIRADAYRLLGADKLVHSRWRRHDWAVSARCSSTCQEQIAQLVLALGKDSNAYLVNRNNLGGITAPVAQLSVGFTIGQSSATYTTSQGTYFVFRPGSTVKAYKITPTTPPTIVFAWSVSQTGSGSPWVTTTDGANNAIVWVVGAQGDQRLHGYNGDTGAIVYAGGGANELMTGTRKWNSGTVARGSIYVANDNKVYAFRIPSGGTPTPAPTPTATAGFTPTATATPAFTPTATATATATASATPTATATATSTATVPPSPTPTPSVCFVTSLTRLWQRDQHAAGGFLCSTKRSDGSEQCPAHRFHG